MAKNDVPKVLYYGNVAKPSQIGGIFVFWLYTCCLRSGWFLSVDELPSTCLCALGLGQVRAADAAAAGSESQHEAGMLQIASITKVVFGSMFVTIKLYKDTCIFYPFYES